jgi:cyanophycinase-like exopeptidase
MTSRIILHGGNSNKKSAKNDTFFREIVTGVGKNTIQILCVYFARPEGRWENSYAEDQAIFRALAIEMGLDIETKQATYNMEELLQAIADADVVFINGGYKGHLKETLLAIGVDNFRQMIQSKTLVGISAGANLLSHYYYSQGIDDIRAGVGLLNLNILTHYHADRPEHMEKLKAYSGNIPIVTIAEEEYTIINL